MTREERHAIELEGLTLGFPGLRVLEGASARVPAGQMVALVGPSGSGKSTLFHFLLGNLPDAARVGGVARVFGVPIQRHYPPELLRRLGVVFQQDALFEDLSARGNLDFVLPRGVRDRKSRIDELLRQVGLEGVKNHVSSLSGGQRKRLALARTLAAEPELILFDEPTSGLDPGRSLQIAELIRQTHVEANPRRTTLIITHDREAILPIADRILYVDPETRGLLDLTHAEAAARLTRAAPKPTGSRGESPWRGEGAEPLPSPAPAPSPERRAPPAPGKGLAPSARPGFGRFARLFVSAFAAVGAAVEPVFRFLLEPLPSSLRQFWLRLREACLGPASFIGAASILIGALASFFALENNPLRGAMDRPVLVGLGKVLVSVVAPLCAGCLFAARVGAGETARLGHLRYSRQVDALRCFGKPRTGYLESPLLWACMLALPLLTAASASLASLASLLVSTQIRQLSPHGWASAYFQELMPADLPWMLLKSLGSGLFVGLTSVRHGLAPKSSAEDISDSVTAAIVSGSLGVILWQSLLTLQQF